ncbi:MAG: hypothetical protein M0015_15725 [Betaproteobacteria bacterium]|nr:hypothetical protein [Betaproteobacteria bacterium]
MGGSFNTREFFHGVERGRLRALKLGFIGAAFVIPMLAFGAFARHAGVERAVVGFVSQYAGLLAERWYFFAEARHPQNLYCQTIS